MKLSGKVAIVTGGGSGIGRAICRRIAADGAKVVVADYNVDSANAVAAEIAAGGGEAVGVAVDVRDVPQTERMVAQIPITFRLRD